MGELEKLKLPIPQPTQSQKISTDDYHARWCGKEGCTICIVARDSVPELANPHCVKCKGSGWLYPVEDGNYINYRKFIPCDAPGCHAEGFNKSRETVQTFGNFSKRERGAKESFDAAMKFSDLKLKFLLLFGKTGFGKTHLLNAIRNKMLLNRHEVEFYTVNALLDRVKDAMQSNQAQVIEDQITSFEVLLLDDLKIDEISGWGLSTISDIVETRYQQVDVYGANLYTALTTNNDLAQIPARMESRFADMKYGLRVLNEAGDYRKKRATEE